LVAYISWQGIKLIHRELEEFYNNGKEISIILGIGDGPNESDAIRYLIQRFTKADIFLFHVPVDHYTFHPKIYIFNNHLKTLAFIGSNNFTTGGLFCNSECCVKLSFDNRNNKEIYREINSIWNSYSQPLGPFKRRNLRRIDQRLLVEYSKRNLAIQKTRQKVNTQAFDKLFPAIQIERPVVPMIKLPKKKKKEKYRTTLLLEILRETGMEGTQVQIPRKVIDEYFDVPGSGHQTVELKFKNNPIRPAVICHFSNNTHRISFPEVAGVKRPLLMKFNKFKKNIYTVELIKGKEYEKLIKLCTNQTRSAARRWGEL